MTTEQGILDCPTFNGTSCRRHHENIYKIARLGTSDTKEHINLMAVGIVHRYARFEWSLQSPHLEVIQKPEFEQRLFLVVLSSTPNGLEN